MRRTIRRTRVTGWAAAAAGILLLPLGSPASADPEGIHKFATGTFEEGSLTVPLYRGAAVVDEFMVAATKDCGAHLTLRIKWSKSDNLVGVQLTGEGALAPLQTVRRAPWV